MTAPATETPRERLVFDEVYATYFSRVYKWVRAHGCPSADAEDVVQNVFMIVQRKLPAFDGEHLAAWLYRVATRTTRDYRRSAWFRNLFSRSTDIETVELASEKPDASELLEEREARSALDDIVSRMNPTWRGVFVLFEIEGESGDEIARLEGITEAALWTRLHRARKEFAALVAARTSRKDADATPSR